MSLVVITACLVNCVIPLLPKFSGGIVPPNVSSSSSILLPSVISFSPAIKPCSMTILTLLSPTPIASPIKRPVSVPVSKSMLAPSSMRSCKKSSNTNSSDAELCSNIIPPSGGSLKFLNPAPSRSNLEPAPAPPIPPSNKRLSSALDAELSVPSSAMLSPSESKPAFSTNPTVSNSTKSLIDKPSKSEIFIPDTVLKSSSKSILSPLPVLLLSTPSNTKLSVSIAGSPSDNPFSSCTPPGAINKEPAGTPEAIGAPYAVLGAVISGLTDNVVI